MIQRALAVVVATAASAALFGCASSPTASAGRDRPAIEAPPIESPTIADLAWLSGSWAGEHDGGIIEEHWTAPAGNSMSGMARLVVDGKTVFFEFLRIVQKPDGGVVYLAQPVGRHPPTPFTLTRLSTRQAAFENPTHDNPTLIRYTLEADGDELVTFTQGQENGQTQTHEARLRRASLTAAR